MNCDLHIGSDGALKFILLYPCDSSSTIPLYVSLAASMFLIFKEQCNLCCFMPLGWMMSKRIKNYVLHDLHEILGHVQTMILRDHFLMFLVLIQLKHPDDLPMDLCYCGESWFVFVNYLLFLHIRVYKVSAVSSLFCMS